MDELYRVTAPNFVAGLVVHQGRVVDCAPILRRLCLGKPMSAIRNLFAWRGWQYERVQ